MITWWSSLSTGMQVLWAITLASSLIFVIQSVATFIGADTGGIDTDFDVDFDADLDAGGDPSTGMGLLTFRNFINFLLGFGWSAVLLRDSISSLSLLLTVSILVGALLVFLVMMLFKWLNGMQQSGNINLENKAVGCTGQVYLTIPGERAGEGKVQITISSAVREYAALTDSDTLKTGTPIKVVDVLNGTTLLVEPLNSLII